VSGEEVEPRARRGFFDVLLVADDPAAEIARRLLDLTESGLRWFRSNLPRRGAEVRPGPAGNGIVPAVAPAEAAPVRPNGAIAPPAALPAAPPAEEEVRERDARPRLAPRGSAARVSAALFAAAFATYNLWWDETRRRRADDEDERD
jgi:hypothetical protein